MGERRREGGRLLKAGKLTKAEIARQLGVSRTAVSAWATEMENGGLRALKQRIAPGRPRNLTPEQEREVIRHLKRGALAAGFPTDRWTLQRIQQLIEREFGVTHHPNYLQRVLDRLDWTPQVPQPRAVERDEEFVRAWLEHDWPRIKKGAAKRA